MADGLDLSELVRRTVQANARFYKGWVDLSLEYFRHITEIFGGAPDASSQMDDLETGAGALVLEGEAGTAATGAFLVTNDLGRTIKCDLVASDFKDSDGNAIPAKTTFEPAAFDLAPGEQRVVRATMPIDGKLTAGVAYSGAFSIRGMDGFSVPAVVRRQHRAEESPIDRMAAGAPEKRGGKPASAARPPAKKAGRGKPTTKRSRKPK
jgi:hypothetical protein